MPVGDPDVLTWIWCVRMSSRCAYLLQSTQCTLPVRTLLNDSQMGNLLVTVYIFRFHRDFSPISNPVDWREISTKQSVGKCKQINFCFQISTFFFLMILFSVLRLACIVPFPVMYVSWLTQDYGPQVSNSYVLYYSCQGASCIRLTANSRMLLHVKQKGGFQIKSLLCSVLKVQYGFQSMCKQTCKHLVRCTLYI